MKPPSTWTQQRDTFVKELRKRVPDARMQHGILYRKAGHTVFIGQPIKGHFRLYFDVHDAFLPGKRLRRAYKGHDVEITVAVEEAMALLPFAVGLMLDVIVARSTVYERSPRAVAISHGAPRRVGKTPPMAWLETVSSAFRMAGAP